MQMSLALMPEVRGSYKYDQIRVGFCLLCLVVEVYCIVLSCVFFLSRFVPFTLVMSCVSKGFPYKDQIEE